VSSRKEQNRSRKHGDRLRREAQEALEAGDLALARKLIARALEEGLGNARYWKEQGEILLALGETRAAERSLRQALTLSPDYAGAIDVLAGLLEDRGDRELARELRERLERPGVPADSERGDASESEPQPVAVPLLTAGCDWQASESALVAHGIARLAGVLSREQCAAWSTAARASASPPTDVPGASCGAHLADARGPWDALVAELVSLLAAIAARASERLGRGRPALSAEFLPGRGPIARSWSLAPDAPAELPIPASRPRFPFSIALVLAADPAVARCVLSLVDLRPGRKEHAHRCEAELGDVVIACARDRWVRVGTTFGLQTVSRRLEAGGGTLEVLELSY
jgi:hypothetical protein